MILTQLLQAKHDKEADEEGQIGAQTGSIFREYLEEHHVYERAAGESLQNGGDQTGSGCLLAVIYQNPDSDAQRANHRKGQHIENGQ